MSEANEPSAGLSESERIGSRQPFDLDEKLAARVSELGLASQLDQLRDEGYTIIPDVAPAEFTAELRETCRRLSQETHGAAKGRSAALLLGRDTIFEDVVLHPKVQTLVQVMCGKGALLSQLIASIRPNGAPEIGLHADQNWTPAPFPVHNQILTLCWTMDDYTKAAGCTKVIPKSHLERRHPNARETTEQPGAIPTECSSSSLVCWDGSIWHGNYPRTIEGERVVLHITFSRLALRPVENYDHLDAAWLDGRPKLLSIMLGREDFLGSTTIERGSADYSLIPKSFLWARS